MFSVRNELWVNVQVAMFVSTVNRIEGLKWKRIFVSKHLP
jgi:hypothetical protein